MEEQLTFNNQQKRDFSYLTDSIWVVQEVDIAGSPWNHLLQTFISMRNTKILALSINVTSFQFWSINLYRTIAGLFRTTYM